MARVVRITDDDFNQLRDQANANGVTLGEAFSERMRRAAAAEVPAPDDAPDPGIGPTGVTDPGPKAPREPTPETIEANSKDGDNHAQPAGEPDGPNGALTELAARGVEVHHFHHLDDEQVERALAVIGQQFQATRQGVDDNAVELEDHARAIGALALMVRDHRHAEDGSVDPTSLQDALDYLTGDMTDPDGIAAVQAILSGDAALPASAQ